MDTLRTLGIAQRLTLGFGAVLLLMAAVIGSAVLGLNNIAQEVQNICESDWVKAEAANTINVTTRSNARRTMELFFAKSPEQVQAIQERITQNKAVIDKTLNQLDQMVTSTEGRELLRQIKEKKIPYVQSFTRVQTQLREGQRNEAEKELVTQTLPAIDALQEQVRALSDLQTKRVKDRGQSAIADARSKAAWALGLGITALLLGALIAYQLSRSITRPIAQAVTLAESVANGHLNVQVTVRGRDETSRLLTSLNTMAANLSTLVHDVRRGSESIATGSSQIAMGTADLSQRTEEQAANLQQTASSMEQLSSTVRANAAIAQDASGLADQARDVAAQGGTVMAQLIDTMDDITQSSKKIGEIIGVIDGIAFQTNILALNAAVEAARAGEQGRGFSVVASEVRLLAQRSAEAAREIKSLIGNSVDKVQAGGQLVSDAGQSIDAIVQQVREVSTLINQISQASSEQTQGISQINDAVTQLDQVTQQNAALVEESAAASSSLNTQATRLVAAVQMFKLA
ncbi:MAG: MCP four helix bundle domain-containing protein [Burkholderiales bacterium]|nr:MCP four helix bundle domain-containing protein [Burkholderiales bacterium]